MGSRGAAGKRVIVVDLFPHAKLLPSNIVEVLARRDEIVYAARIRRAGAEQALLLRCAKARRPNPVARRRCE
jgi:hypothetical protein